MEEPFGKDEDDEYAIDKFIRKEIEFGKFGKGEGGWLYWLRTTQEETELEEEQYPYLMMGLNSLNLEIKNVTPQKKYIY